MDKKQIAETVIEALGGIEKAVEMFGYSGPMSLRNNWYVRGIPRCHHLVIFKETGIDVTQLPKKVA